MLQRLLKHLTIILLIFTTILQPLTVFAEDSQPNSTVEIASPSAILINADTGQILYEKDSNAKMYPASITKIMTAVLALEKGNLQSKVIMSKRAVYQLERGSSNVGFLEGEELTIEQLLYAMMLNSANEAANGIAEAIGGNIENFAKMMTQRAKELGAKNTNFVTPNGLHNPDHYTTAYDMAMIAKHAMSIPKFREIVSTTHYLLPPTNKMPKEKDFYNSNKLIRTDSKYYYPDAIGVKTGYTTIAGSTLVSAASKNGVELIAVVLNAPIDGYNSYMYIDSRKLLDYGFENFVPYKMADKNTVVSSLKVKGSGARVTALPQKDFVILLPKNANKNSIKMLNHLNSLQAPVRKGDVIGYISFEDNGKVVGNVNLVAGNDAGKNLLTWLAFPVKKTFFSITWFIIKWVIFIIISLIILSTAFVYFYNQYKRYQRKRRKRLFY